MDSLPASGPAVALVTGLVVFVAVCNAELVLNGRTGFQPPSLLYTFLREKESGNEQH